MRVFQSHTSIRRSTTNHPIMYTISVSIQIHVYSITHAYRQCSDLLSAHDRHNNVHASLCAHPTPIRPYGRWQGHVFSVKNRRPSARPISRITVDTRQAAYYAPRSKRFTLPTDFDPAKKLSYRRHDTSCITNSTNI